MDAISAMLNIFIDPKASVDRFQGKKWGWLWPVLVMGAISAVVGFVVAPLTVRVMLENPPQGANVEQLRQSAGVIETIQKVGAMFSPVIIAVMMAISSALVLAACAVLDIKAKFSDVMALLAHCSLISFVQVIAGGLVVYSRRDEIQNMIELQPAFGLNLLLPEGSSKLLYGLLGYFSVFTIWYIVIMGIAFAYMAKVSRGKGFGATCPVWILGLLFSVIGAIFRPA